LKTVSVTVGERRKARQPTTHHLAVIGTLALEASLAHTTDRGIGLYLKSQDGEDDA